MKPKKKKKQQQKKKSESLLTRLIKTGGEGKKGSGTGGGKTGLKKAGKPSGNGEVAAADAPATDAQPKTPLDRSIQEIKHMMKVGESDPERLAMLLSKLLGTEQEKMQRNQEQFDKMVWDIVNSKKDN